jgi:tetratricopeptide (TPR) repeat protein
MRKLAVFLTLLTSAQAAAAGHQLALTALESAPQGGRKAASAADLERLRTEVAAEPRDRQRRYALVQALIASGRLDEALSEAQAWREVDAYNLVVVRMIGDIYAEKGDLARAKRTYSAVVELLPEDADAHRALATVLKQSGNLTEAYDRLVIATRLKPADQRIAFELADVAARLGRDDEAEQRFQDIIAAPDVQPAVAYPARQRLGQIWAAARRKNPAAAADLDQKIAGLDIHGGVENDIKVYLSWDTNGSDIDLWVTNPAGTKIFYQHKQGAPGEALFDDVTTGYGPESFTARDASAGTYLVQVNYYGTNRAAFLEARGEVIVILNEGTAREEKHVLPYRLYAPEQTVTIAKVEVK